MPDYPPAVAELLVIDHPTALGPGAPAAALRAKIKAAGAGLPPACAAGLWLRFDFLDESHVISQEDESAPDRNFWHAIMHRREPDAWNSKYWWRRVGPHPALRADPFAFVDRVEACIRGRGGDAEELRTIQRAEWDALFAHCLARAVGG